MPTECRAELFDFGTVEGRAVEAAFDAGLVTSDAGALLLGATDRAMRMTARFAACFHDERRRDLIEHEVATLVGQRVFGIALGYEDLNDHDELRHDPMMAVLAGKLEARREECAPVAGKSTLNRLELSKLEPARYHKISHNPVAIKHLLVDLFLEAHERAPRQIILDLDATDDPLHGEQEGRFFHGYYDCYCYLPLYVFCGRHLLVAKLRRAGPGAAGAGSSPRPNGRRGKPILVSSSPRSDATSARPSIFTRRSTAPAATWRTGSRSASSTSMRIAPRPPRCGPTSCACGSTRWLMSCCAPCAGSGSTIPSLRRLPAAPFASSCSRSVRSCASASAASRSRWRRPVRPRRSGASLRSGSPPPQRPAPRPHDTRRRGAILARHNQPAHGDPEKPDLHRAPRRHGPSCLQPRSRRNWLTRCAIHQ